MTTVGLCSRRFLRVKVVVERRVRRHQHGLLAKPSAALQRAELAGHVAGVPGGRESGVGGVESVFVVPAIVGMPEPRRRA